MIFSLNRTLALMKMNAFFPICRLFLIFFTLIAFSPLFSGKPAHAHTPEEIPKDVILVLRYLLDKVDAAPPDIDVDRLSPLPAFLDAEKSPDILYQTDNLMDMPAAFNLFRIKTDLARIMGYTLNENIPSLFFWPSSLRMSGWTHLDGGKEQLARLQEASADPDATFMLKGEEHIEITPDQHTGAYYVYDVDKVMTIFPHQKGRVLLVVFRQKGPSDIGLKGWVLGKDEDWTYVYTKDRGINVPGLGWAKTYMYDSFGVTLYWQKDLAVPEVICGTFSGVNAGWANMNMVKPHHIFAGMTRVSRAFKDVMENPKLPASSQLSATFARSRDLSLDTLQEYGLFYFETLGQRVEAMEDAPKDLKKELDPGTLVDQMSRDELFSLLALDYFKKILDRDPILKTHPF